MNVCKFKIFDRMWLGAGEHFHSKSPFFSSAGRGYEGVLAWLQALQKGYVACTVGLKSSSLRSKYDSIGNAVAESTSARKYDSIVNGPAENGSVGQTLQGSFSAVSKPNFASKYAFESPQRDLHNALLCTALKSHISTKKIARIFPKNC